MERLCKTRCWKRALIAVILGMAVAFNTHALVTTSKENGAQVSSFEGVRAMGHVGAMVDLGPRPLGTKALEQTRTYIESELRAIGLEPRRDEFVASTPVGEVPMANIIAEIPAMSGASGKILLLASHFDTKLYDGFEFLGANDGGSSTGALLEIGRVLSATPPPVPIWLVFFDGEEAVGDWAGENNTYGSRHMAQRMLRDGNIEEIGALVLLDMIGDAGLVLEYEMNSTEWLRDLVWSVADEVGHGEHFGHNANWMSDDHQRFTEVGVPALDLIDFNYGPANRYWHSPMDTLDKLSEESLQAIGDTVLAAIPRIAERLRSHEE